MKRAMMVVGFVLAMVGLTLLLNALQSPVWFSVLVALGESVLFAVALTDGRGKS